MQINRGNRVGAAAHDYIERQVVITKGSQLVPMPPSDRSVDAQSRISEDAFFERFGFDAPEGVRRAVVATKQRYQLTARMIRHLKFLGFLHITERGVFLRRSRLELWAGLALIAATGCMSAVLFALLLVAPPQHAVAAAGVTALAALYAAGAATTYAIHVRPNVLVDRLLRRRGA